jgi:hypothetical protein
VRVRPRSPGPVVIELGEQRICTDADGFKAVAAAPGAASVRVWTIMSRGRGPRGGHRCRRALMLTILCGSGSWGGQRVVHRSAGS